MTPDHSESHRWFALELQPHVPMLKAWLRGQFPREADIEDIVQEAILQVLVAHGEGRVHSPKPYLFVTARNVAVGQLRKKRVVSSDAMSQAELWGILDESADVPQAVARNQELELLTEGIQALPTRCRQILTLRKIYGLSQKDVAADLGVSEKTVETQSAIGLRKLEEFFSRVLKFRPP